MAVLFVASNIFMGAAFHAGRESFTVANLIFGLPFGVVGGYLAARIAKRNELGAATGLFILSAVVNVVALSIDRGRQPLWYAFVLLGLIVAGVYAGAMLRRRGNAGA